MNKTQSQIIKNAVENLNAASTDLHDHLISTQTEIEREMETIRSVKDELTEEFDDLSEEKQESEEGEALQETINELSDIYNDLENLNTELEESPFDDILTRLKVYLPPK
jgi:hypothetical protein